jgi:hypothetical protein
VDLGVLVLMGYKLDLGFPLFGVNLLMSYGLNESGLNDMGWVGLNGYFRHFQ